MGYKSISTQTLQRLPLYLNYLKRLPRDGTAHISATAIAQALDLNDVQVRKDLASVSTGGRPKVGYVTAELIGDLEAFLGYDNPNSAVLVGAGNLGRALLSYEALSGYGLEIVAAFDVNEALFGASVSGKKVLPMAKMKDLCARMKIKTGIITVPVREAQKVCDQMINSGILAIWNFAPVHLQTPENVMVKNENPAPALTALFRHLSGSSG